MSSEQLRQAWHALRQGFRTLGINHRGELLSWLRFSGFICLGQGEYFEREAQEYLLECTAERDAEVGNLGHAYVCVAMALGRSAGLLQFLTVRARPQRTEVSEESPAREDCEQEV
eukprot:4190914-Karenia_brevis.AAC.1